MLNFLKKNAALIWAKKHVQKAEEFKKNAGKKSGRIIAFSSKHS